MPRRLRSVCPSWRTHSRTDSFVFQLTKNRRSSRRRLPPVEGSRRRFSCGRLPALARTPLPAPRCRAHRPCAVVWCRSFAAGEGDRTPRPARAGSPGRRWGARRRPRQNSQRVLLAAPRGAVQLRMPLRPRITRAARWGHRALPPLPSQYSHAHYAHHYAPRPVVRPNCYDTIMLRK